MLVGTGVTYSAEQAEDQSFVLLPPSFSAPAKCCVNNEFLTIDPVSGLTCVEVAGWIARWAVLSHVRRGPPLPPRRFSLTTTPLEHRTSASGRSFLVPRMFCPTGSMILQCVWCDQPTGKYRPAPPQLPRSIRPRRPSAGLDDSLRHKLSTLFSTLIPFPGLFSHILSICALPRRCYFGSKATTVETAAHARARWMKMVKDATKSSPASIPRLNASTTMTSLSRLPRTANSSKESVRPKHLPP